VKKSAKQEKHLLNFMLVERKLTWRHGVNLQAVKLDPAQIDQILAKPFTRNDLAYKIREVLKND
jgi:hypothetical protein